MARTGELTETLRTRVDADTKKALEAKASAEYRSVGAVVRAAIRSYLAKGKR